MTGGPGRRQDLGVHRLGRCYYPAAMTEWVRQGGLVVAGGV